MSWLDCLDPTELAIIALIVSLVLSSDQNADELNVWGNFVVAVGGLMLVIAAQKQFRQNKQQEKEQEKEDIQQQLQSLQKMLEQLIDAKKPDKNAEDGASFIYIQGGK
ncbi:MAG: hypothetical protein PHU78_06100 [Heliobacteriaceae bacterium]|nr:hypothetical protein [Heliobacteriaceae bacterium]